MFKKTNVEAFNASFFFSEGFEEAMDELNVILQNGAPTPKYDRTFAIAYSLGVASKIHADIAKLHAKKEVTYYKAFKESVYASNAGLKKLSPANQQAVRHMIGMMLTESPRLLEETLLKLFKKGYHFIFIQIKNASYVDGAKVRSSVFSYHDKQKLSDTTNSFALMTAILYISGKLNKNIALMDDDPTEPFCKKYLISYAIVQADTTLHTYSKKHPVQDVLYEQLAALFPVLQFKVKQQPFSHFLLFLHTEMNEHFTTNPIHLPLGMLGTFMTALDVHAIELQDRKMITKQLFLNIFNFYLLNSWDAKQSGLSHTDLERLIVLLYVYMLTDDLTAAREVLMDTTMSERLMELEQIVVEQKRVKVSLEKQYETMHSNQKQLTQKNEQLLEEVRQLQNKVAKLEKELEAKQVVTQQVVQQQVIEADAVSFDEQLAFVQTFSFAFVGETSKWYMQLAQLLPRTMHVSINDLNKDFTAVRAFDYICLKTDVNKHTLTAKLAKYNDAAPLYLPDGTNIELTIQYMYELLVNK